MALTTTTNKSSPPQDRSSLSHPEDVCVTHIDWNVTVDFDSQIISGSATYTLDYPNNSATVLDLDTAHLNVTRVIATRTETALNYTLHPANTSKPHLGRQLSIITCGVDIRKVTVFYNTTNESSAVQWLPPEQTAGRKYPYLFTQCQAIHARSLLPCQDRPGVKTTYTANVTVPSWSTCVMSALLDGVIEKSTTTTKEYSFHQPVPISSYLIAMAVGDLAKVDISKRCAVWSEPSMVDKAAYEFDQTEDFLKIAEDLAGMPYQVSESTDILFSKSDYTFEAGFVVNPCIVSVEFFCCSSPYSSPITSFPSLLLFSGDAMMSW